MHDASDANNHPPSTHQIDANQQPPSRPARCNRESDCRWMPVHSIMQWLAKAQFTHHIITSQKYPTIHRIPIPTFPALIPDPHITIHISRTGTATPRQFHHGEGQEAPAPTAGRRGKNHERDRSG